MTTPRTAAEIDAILALADKATPGPWNTSFDGSVCVYAGEFMVCDADPSDECGPQHHLDAAFIAKCQDMADIIRQQRSEIAELQERIIQADIQIFKLSE